ncbi:hypothetical protein [Aliivibrio fischeri]|uniref:Uncharacterized protein n=1 Tax=Aliivibrio fischeri TaxID=668 RepID=A0A510UBT9_ALIFS|nr:hypothetical protein [Aliivibrio fischeri]GEK12038.1 hypothetical protein AFI02nite_00740 [Aliivibrio fischeri]
MHLNNMADKIEKAIAAFPDQINFQISSKEVQNKLFKVHADLENILSTFQYSHSLWEQLKCVKEALDLIEDLESNLILGKQFVEYIHRINDAWYAILTPLLVTIIESSSLGSLDETITECKKVTKDLINTASLTDTKLAELTELISETEKRIIDKANKIYENSEQNIQLTVNDATNYINDQVNDINVKLDNKVSNFERKISDVSNRAKQEHNEYIQLIAENFELKEEEASNRIQYYIQRVELQGKEITQKVDLINNELTDLVSQQQTSLKEFANKARSDVISSIEKSSSDSLSKIQLAQSSALNSFNEQINKEVSNINTRIKKEVDLFESKRENMDKLLEKVGLAKDADVTITQADKEEAMANKLRFYGLSLMYGSIALLIIFFAEYIGLNFWSTSSKSLSDLTLNDFIIRFMTILLVSSPAVYLLKESAYHRNKENLYRQRGTQLLTIRGYLADLQPEERTKVKQDLAKNFFSFHDGKTDTQNVPDFVRDMKEAVSIAKSINSPTPKRRSTILGNGSK